MVGWSQDVPIRLWLAEADGFSRRTFLVLCWGFMILHEASISIAVEICFILEIHDST